MSSGGSVVLSSLPRIGYPWEGDPQSQPAAERESHPDGLVLPVLFLCAPSQCVTSGKHVGVLGELRIQARGGSRGWCPLVLGSKVHYLGPVVSKVESMHPSAVQEGAQKISHLFKIFYFIVCFIM